ncbi:MAG: HlyD family type I secretion periplasmic adaptor subunit [Syntrophotaleaceae bacterium]
MLWAALGKIDIVAVARGKIVPSDYTKLIQPLESGVIKAIHVRDGQQVHKGELLIELDPTVRGAERERLAEERQMVQVEIARLQAVLSGRRRFEPPTGAKPDYLSLQQRLLANQLQEHHSRLEAARRIIEQRQAAIMATKADLARLEQTLPIIAQRAAAHKTLFDEGLASRLEYSEAEKEHIEISQELAATREHLVQQQAALAEAHGNHQAIDSEFGKEIRRELAAAETRALTLDKELVKARHNTHQQQLRAPIDGIVQQLAVHTVGGVVTEAQQLMVVVPQEDRLEIDAWIENKDIGFVDAGQQAEIKVDAFPFTRYGIIEGKILTLSRDAVPMEEAGYVYAARVSMAKSVVEVENGKQVNLSPGMNVAVEIKTGQRRLIEYFLSPLLRAAKESARER